MAAIKNVPLKAPIKYCLHIHNFPACGVCCDRRSDVQGRTHEWANEDDVVQDFCSYSLPCAVKQILFYGGGYGSRRSVGVVSLSPTVPSAPSMGGWHGVLSVGRLSKWKCRVRPSPWNKRARTKEAVRNRRVVLCSPGGKCWTSEWMNEWRGKGSEAREGRMEARWRSPSSLKGVKSHMLRWSLVTTDHPFTIHTPTIQREQVQSVINQLVLLTIQY